MINCFIFQVSHKNLSWSKEGILSSHSLTIDPQNWPMTSSEKSWPTASFICELLVSIYVDRRHYFYLEWSQNELFATCHIQLVWGPLIFQGQQSRCSSSPSVLLKMWQSRSSSPSSSIFYWPYFCEQQNRYFFYSKKQNLYGTWVACSNRHFSTFFRDIDKVWN